MADTKTTALTENTAPILTDIMPMVDDPGGSAATQKVTMTNLQGLMAAGMYPGGRLTLTTATPVTTADVSAAATLYYTPYIHDNIRLYDGTTWRTVSFTEKSITLVGTTASKPYDVWGYLSGGTLALELLVWTDATNRATALNYQNGRLVKTGAATRLYLGTIYINSSGGQTDDSLIKRNVWNYYNRVTRRLYKTDATNHVYSGVARQWNNAATNQVEATVGVVEEAISISFIASFDSVNAQTAFVAMDVDAATAADRDYPLSLFTITSGTNYGAGTTFPLALLGRHYFTVLERSTTNINFLDYYLYGAING